MKNRHLLRRLSSKKGSLPDHHIGRQPQASKQRPMHICMSARRMPIIAFSFMSAAPFLWNANKLTQFGADVNVFFSVSCISDVFVRFRFFAGAFDECIHRVGQGRFAVDTALAGEIHTGEQQLSRQAVRVPVISGAVHKALERV